MSSNRLTFEIAADAAPRLDKALSLSAPEEAALSRSRLARLIEEGAVRVSGEVVTSPKAKVRPGQEVIIDLPAPAETHMAPEDILLDIAFEDNDLVVVNKPAGMVVHPAPGTPSGTLVNALLAHCGDSLSGVGGQARPGIVHRIDKDTSGLLVVAKTDAAHQGLADQFAAHSAERLYQAICYGVPDVGDPRISGLRGISFEPGGVVKITTGLDRHKTDRQRQAVFFDRGRHAVTRVHLVEDLGDAALVSCQLETGRTHQIRVHMAYAGHGLLGDPTYGGGKRLKGARSEIAAGFARQALHAATLGFEHPISGEMMRFEADMPEDMAGLLARLRV